MSRTRSRDTQMSDSEGFQLKMGGFDVTDSSPVDPARINWACPHAIFFFRLSTIDWVLADAEEVTSF